MSSVKVAFTPGSPDDCSVAVVIDVLRATSTITRALESGYRQVLACGDLDQARELAERVDGSVVLAGERKCLKPEGFDLGNSPAEYTPQRVSGRPLVVLAAATRTLPDDTYLTEMELRQRKVTLSGRSAAAARLIGALAEDGEFKNPAFAAPVTRLEALRAELFTINAEVGP